MFPAQALSVLLLPRNIPPSLQLLTTMVDDIWHYAGDQSTDVSPGALHSGRFCPSALQQTRGWALGRVTLKATHLLYKGDVSRSTQKLLRSYSLICRESQEPGRQNAYECPQG